MAGFAALSTIRQLRVWHRRIMLTAVPMVIVASAGIATQAVMMALWRHRAEPGRNLAVPGAASLRGWAVTLHTGALALPLFAFSGVSMHAGL